MAHQPPKQGKKAPQHTPKEKKTLKQQKKHASDTPPFFKNDASAFNGPGCAARHRR